MTEYVAWNIHRERPRAGSSHSSGSGLLRVPADEIANDIMGVQLVMLNMNWQSS